MRGFMKALSLMQMGLLARALSKWIYVCREQRRVKRTVLKMMQRMRTAVQAVVWATWDEAVVDLKRLRQVANKHLLHWTKLGMQRAWVRWTEFSQDKARFRLAATKLVTMMKFKGMCQAFMAFQFSVGQAMAGHMGLERVASRWRLEQCHMLTASKVLLSNVLKAWLCKRHRMSVQVAGRCIRRLARFSLEKSLRQWEAQTQQTVRAREACSILAARSRHFALWFAFNSLCSNVDKGKQTLVRASKVRCKMREKTLSAAFWTWSLTAEEVTPVAVAITLSKDFEATFTDEAAVQQLDAGLQEDICAALGVDLAAVSVLCHQRGSIIAEVALRGSGDGRDARSAASLSAELVSQVKDCSSALRSRPIGSVAMQAEVHGVVSEPVCLAVMASQRIFLTRMQAVGQQAQQRLDGLRRRVVCKMRNGFVASTFELWVQRHQRQRLTYKISARVLLRWSNLALAEAWRAWQEIRREKLRLKGVFTKLVMRSKYWQLCTAMGTWSAVVGELRRLKRSAAVILRRWRGGVLCAAYGCWISNATERRQMRKVVQRLMHAIHGKVLGSFFRDWTGHYVAKQRVVRTMSAVVDRLVHRCLLSAWLRWVEAGHDGRRLRCIARRVLNRLSNKTKSSGFEAFRAYYMHSEETNALLAASLCRWQSAQVRMDVISQKRCAYVIDNLHMINDKQDIPVAVGITLDKDFEATFTDEAAVQQLDAGLQEDICAALGVDLAAVSVLCHQRGSIIAEVALRGSGDGRDARSAASLSAELVSQVKDCSSALRSRPIGSVAMQAEVHGVVSEPVCLAVMASQRIFLTRMQAVGQQAQQRLDGLRRRVVCKMRNGFVASTFELWVQRHQRQRLTYKISARVLLRWSNLALAEAWRAWQEIRREKLRLKGVFTKLVMRSKYWQLCTAMGTWSAVVGELRRLKRSAAVILRRWRGGVLCAAYGCWISNATERRQMRKVVQRLMHAIHGKVLGSFFRDWTGHYVAKQRVVRTMSAVVDRLVHRCLLSAWLRWVEAGHDGRRLRCIARRVLNRLSNKTKSSGFEAFRAYYMHSEETNALLAASLCRWQSAQVRMDVISHKRSEISWNTFFRSYAVPAENAFSPPRSNRTLRHCFVLWTEYVSTSFAARHECALIRARLQYKFLACMYTAFCRSCKKQKIFVAKMALELRRREINGLRTAWLLWCRTNEESRAQHIALLRMIVSKKTRRLSCCINAWVLLCRERTSIYRRCAKTTIYLQRQFCFFVLKEWASTAVQNSFLYVRTSALKSRKKLSSLLRCFSRWLLFLERHRSIVKSTASLLQKQLNARKLLLIRCWKFCAQVKSNYCFLVSRARVKKQINLKHGILVCWRSSGLGESALEIQILQTATRKRTIRQMCYVICAWLSAMGDVHRRSQALKLVIYKRYRILISSSIQLWLAGMQNVTIQKRKIRSHLHKFVKIMSRTALQNWKTYHFVCHTTYNRMSIILKKYEMNLVRLMYKTWRNNLLIIKNGLLLHQKVMIKLAKQDFLIWADVLNKLRKDRAIICAFLESLLRARILCNCSAVISFWRDLVVNNRTSDSAANKDERSIQELQSPKQTKVTPLLRLPATSLVQGKDANDESPKAKRVSDSSDPSPLLQKEGKDHTKPTVKVKSPAVDSSKSPLSTTPIINRPSMSGHNAHNQQLLLPAISSPQLVSRSSHLLTVKWNPWILPPDASENTVSSVIEYGLEWQEGGTVAGSAWNALPVILKACEATKRNLKPATSYSFRVRARLVGSFVFANSFYCFAKTEIISPSSPFPPLLSPFLPPLYNISFCRQVVPGLFMELLQQSPQRTLTYGLE